MGQGTCKLRRGKLALGDACRARRRWESPAQDRRMHAYTYIRTLWYTHMSVSTVVELQCSLVDCSMYVCMCVRMVRIWDVSWLLMMVCVVDETRQHRRGGRNQPPTTKRTPTFGVLGKKDRPRNNARYRSLSYRRTVHPPPRYVMYFYAYFYWPEYNNQ